MSQPGSTLQRSLRLLIALLALFCGSGAHEALHELGVTRTTERPTSPFEAHGANCPHRGNVPLHDHSQCVLCKSGGVQHVALPHSAPQVERGCVHDVLSLAASTITLAAPIPGSIGARAPPVTVG